MTRFHPIGRRPIDGGNADGGYTLEDFNQYITEANEQRFVVLQIEDPEPLAELEEIAQLEGYDMLFLVLATLVKGLEHRAISATLYSLKRGSGLQRLPTSMVNMQQR